MRRSRRIVLGRGDVYRGAGAALRIEPREPEELVPPVEVQVMDKKPKLVVMPIGMTAARAWIERHHSHHHAPLGGLAAVSVAEGDRVVCVATLSRPVARMLQANPQCAEVNRVASDGTAKHAASMAIGAISRAAFGLGYRRLVSYTMLGEAGTSYRAAGWWPTAESGGGEWFRESHPGHSAAKTVRPERKVRWEFGPDALPRAPDVDAQVRAAVGVVEIRGRGETLPLFGVAGGG